MNTITIFLIAIGLAMDCFAVSICSSVTSCKINWAKALKMSFFFGLFQGGMPVIGWLLGYSLYDYITPVDHWIAFAILSIIGLKMIWEAVTKKPENRNSNTDKLIVLLGLSVATSIDALIVGVSFAFLEVNILKAIVIISVVTFLISLAGIYIGKRFGLMFGNKAEIIGGLVLIGIGCKVLFEHLILR